MQRGKRGLLVHKREIGPSPGDVLDASEAALIVVFEAKPADQVKQI